MIETSLDTLVSARENSAQGNPYRYNPFGFSREGSLIEGFYKHLQFFTSGLFPGSGKDEGTIPVLIHVEPTESGIYPADEKNLPYGWTGKINSHTAERAVWWAYEIMTETEGREFMRENKPAVTFTYSEGGRLEELKVKYNGYDWIVIYSSGG